MTWNDDRSTFQQYLALRSGRGLKMGGTGGSVEDVLDPQSTIIVDVMSNAAGSTEQLLAAA